MALRGKVGLNVHAYAAAQSSFVNSKRVRVSRLPLYEKVSLEKFKFWKGYCIILLTPKTIGNRKRDCAWSCSRWQTQPQKICKPQRTNQCHSLCTLYWFVLCNLHIFSGCACHLEQLHAQSPFLFPMIYIRRYGWHKDVFILFKRFDGQRLRQWNSLLGNLDSSWPLHGSLQ